MKLLVLIFIIKIIARSKIFNLKRNCIHVNSKRHMSFYSHWAFVDLGMNNGIAASDGREEKDYYLDVWEDILTQSMLRGSPKVDVF